MGVVILGVDFKQPKAERLAAAQHERVSQGRWAEALELQNARAALAETIPYGGQGIDGMFTDTSCSEMNPDQSA